MTKRKDSSPRRPAAASKRKRGLTWWSSAALLPLWFACALCAGPSPEAADELRAADAIFLGSLLEKESFLSEDGRLIWTRHRFAVEDSIYGAGAAAVEVFELGGTVGDVSLSVSHGASYRRGRSYLIIARRDVQGRLQTWGGPDGALAILQDGSGKRVARLRAGGPLQSLMEGPARLLYGLDEIRARLTALRRQTGEDR